jgi:uncharacterized SAM-binding protein YcdF (DUF218 family)
MERVKAGADGTVCGPPVLVVLGAAVREDGSVSAAMRRRVVRAVAEARARPGARVLLSGGLGKRHPPGLPPEAHLMAALARAEGLAPDGLILEDASRDTLENALLSLDALHAAGLASAPVVVVTDRTHLRRALWCFRRVARLRGRTAPIEGLGVPIADRRAHAVTVFWETLALMVYAVRLWRAGRLVAGGPDGHDGHIGAMPHRASPSFPQDPTDPTQT